MSLNKPFVFWRSNKITLELIGYTGTGKSSFVEEVHSRLKLPLYVYNAHPRTTAEAI